MNKKILIVGGAGYIGGYASDFLKKYHDVTVYDNLTYENRYLKNINFIYGDIRDTKKLVDVTKNFDVIILMAGLVGDAACNINHSITEEINHQSIKRFCETLKEENHIIFFSTCSVYGAQNDILDETSPTNPLSLYASTKLASEEHIKLRNGTIFRLGTLYGLGDSHSRIRLDLIVNVLTMNAIFYKTMKIFGGDQWRPILSVKDVAPYLLETIDNNIRGTYILSKENVKIKDLGERIKLLIPDSNIIYTDISYEDARNYKVNISKANTQYKYKPVITPEEEINNLVNIFKQSRIKNIKDEVYNNGLFLIDKLKNFDI
ncbi:MAG: NAD-dependent epimerase/dehydratase family protein [Clostridia bacterium]